MKLKKREDVVFDEMDILKEVGTIAAAHGSIALSTILKKRINLEVPETELISGKTILEKADYDRIGIAIYSKIISGFDGKVIFLLDEKNAFKLNSLAGKYLNDERSSIMTEMGMSVIKEVGSIVSSAYVNAMGMMFRKVILLGVPTFISGTMAEILSVTVISPMQENDEILVIKATFEEPEDKMSGSFYLVLTREAAGYIKQACKDLLLELKQKDK
ncbi:MAG: chemotaxis protein CheC [Candidatus Omnitrophica bacterium]|nr:chemotaxis protein CheC [Candidatus Omnitrophota bacterium]